MLRGEVFLTAVDVLQSGHSVEIVGDYGSGRTHLLNRLRVHFETLGWHVIEVAGVQAFQKSAFASIAMMEWNESAASRQSPGVATIRMLSEHVKPGRTVVLVDDVDWVDEGSLGALSAVSSKFGIPVLFTRSLSGLEAAQQPCLTSGFTIVYSLTLPAMTYAELETTLESVLEVKIEAATMSRVYAKSAGSVGVALAILDAGQRAGSVVCEQGSLRAMGSLWHSSLAALARTLLADLSGTEVRSLRTLALLGSVELAVAAELVPEQRIFELEERSFVTFFERATGTHVALRHPILAEYLRHEATHGQRAQTLGSVGSRAIDGATPAGIEPLQTLSRTVPDEHVVIVRLSHERTRLRTVSAREAWHRSPNLATAAAFLLALEADSSRTDEELESLILQASEMQGNDSECADWSLAWGAHLVYHQGRVEEGISSLEQAAVRYPAEADRLSTQAVLLRTTFGQLPEEEPTFDASVDRPDARLLRVYWLLARGLVVAAEEATCDVDLGPLADPRLVAAAIFTRFSMGDFVGADQLIRDHLAAARNDFDAARLRVFTFLEAYSAFFTHRFDDAEQSLAAAASLGMPSTETPNSFMGLSILSAFLAVRRGQPVLAKAHLDELDALGYREVSLPGMQRAIVTALQSQRGGDRAAAAQHLREAGDSMWARGARLAAANLYLEALQKDPDLEMWKALHPRLLQVDGPVINDWTEFVERLVARDAESIANIVSRIRHKQHGISASQLARTALDALGSDRTMSPGIMDLQELASGRKQAESFNQVELTARELEVAELIASGLSNPQIAEALVVSTRTIESHVGRLMKKIGVQQRSGIRSYLLATGRGR